MIGLSDLLLTAAMTLMSREQPNQPILRLRMRFSLASVVEMKTLSSRRLTLRAHHSFTHRTLAAAAMISQTELRSMERMVPTLPARLILWNSHRLALRMLSL